jgi:hypothetical protein
MGKSLRTKPSVHWASAPAPAPTSAAAATVWTHFQKIPDFYHNWSAKPPPPKQTPLATASSCPHYNHIQYHPISQSNPYPLPPPQNIKTKIPTV